MEILYKPSFLREFKKLPQELQEEAIEKIELFRNKSNHKQLKVHALQGKLKGLKSFSVNYAYRIILEVEKGKKNTVSCIAIGTHTIYK